MRFSLSCRRNFIFTSLTFLFLSSPLFPWGKGHDKQVELVLNLLPEEIKNFFPEKLKGKMIKKYSHYPDSFKEITPDILNNRDKEILKKFRIKVRYDLHRPEGKAISFILMTENFR